MRTGKFIFVLFLFCSLIAQVIGVQNVSSCRYDQTIHSTSSAAGDHIDSFNFFDKNLFDEIEEFEEVEEIEGHNDKKVKKSFCQQLFFLEKLHFRYSSEYKTLENACKSGKYNTSDFKHVILLL